jgi:phosphoribosylanthranilate isomerase
MTVLIKICGVRTANAAKAAQEAGASFLGFNFVPVSKRRVTVLQAEEIIRALPKQGRPKLVGVFQNAKLADVRKIVSALRLDMVQLHGKETAAYAKSVGIPVIRAVALAPDFDVEEVAGTLTDYPAKYFLLDRIERGEGKRLNTKLVAKLAERFSVILAGGLEPDMVRDAVRESGKIVGVDVAGGVDTEGKQELRKIRQFIREAKSV